MSVNYFDRMLQAIDPEAHAAQDHERLEIAQQRLYAAFGDISQDYDVVQRLRPIGGVHMVTADYGADGDKVKLSKASLGMFMEALLRLGGRVTGSYAMAPGYPRSYVQLSVQIPEKRIAQIEQETGIRLEQPPTLKLA